MEKAVLKTLAYYDIFKFPLKAWEIHKWLISSSAGLKQVEKILKRLGQKGKVKEEKGYFFISGRRGITSDRIKREKVSSHHFQTAKYISLLFKIIPWIKLVGVSGSLAMMGSWKKDDIDLFIITGKNRIWITRLFLIMLTSLTGFRRRRREKKHSAAGKICINLILGEDNLGQYKKNIYLAHEVLQMQVLWQRDDIYSKFLHDNDWVFRYLPNWKSGILAKDKGLRVKGKAETGNGWMDWLENLSEKLQLKIMDSPSGQERIESGVLYFHPEDKGKGIMEQYNKRIKDW